MSAPTQENPGTGAVRPEVGGPRPPRRGLRRVLLAVVLAVAAVLPPAVAAVAPAGPHGTSAAAPGDDPGSASRGRSGSGTDPGPGPAAPPDRAGGTPAITVDGDRVLRGGRPWWFLGYNSFVWSGDCGSADEQMSEADVEAWFGSMRHDGHGAARLFFFDGWDVGRLDHAVATARENDVYLMVTLDDAIAGCGESEKDAAWFADAGERTAYADHMTSLLERYRGETAIAWFEFFNEPSYEGGALREFYDDMGALADDVDPDRLFSSGTVAPYWLDGEDNFADVHSSPGVDIGSMHEYDEGEVESNHGPGVLANAGGKPVIVGEFGINAGSGCLGFGERAERVADKARAYIGRGYAGALAWAWQPGGGGCELGNLDADDDTQAVLRDLVG